MAGWLVPWTHRVYNKQYSSSHSIANIQEMCRRNTCKYLNYSLLQQTHVAICKLQGYSFNLLPSRLIGQTNWLCFPVFCLSISQNKILSTLAQHLGDYIIYVIIICLFNEASYVCTHHYTITSSILSQQKHNVFSWTSRSWLIKRTWTTLQKG